jgi:hypothetical protein
LVFAGLLALSAYAGPARYSVDHWLEQRVSWWWRVAEVRRPPEIDLIGLSEPVSVESPSVKDLESFDLYPICLGEERS